jgi:hypothetical protein
MEVRCILTNFTPKFHLVSNLKGQILEIWPSAQESAKTNRAALKSRYLYYKRKVDQMAPTKGIIFLLDLQEDIMVSACYDMNEAYDVMKTQPYDDTSMAVMTSP